MWDCAKFRQMRDFYFRKTFDFTEFKFQMETDKMEYRAVIKFLTLEGQTGQQIYDRMKIIYKEVSSLFDNQTLGYRV